VLRPGIKRIITAPLSQETPMSEQEQPRLEPRRKTLVQHAATMPSSHRNLLMIASLLLVLGLIGQGVALLSSRTAPAPAANNVPTPSNRSNVVGESSQTPDQPPEPLKPSLYQRVSPWMTRVGLSFVVGFVLGWAFRAFLKLMSMIAALGLAVVLGLSYFGVLNVDFTTARHEYQSAIVWMTDQTQRLGKLVLSHVPGSASSFAGFFIGFRRR
jgi:uncharacterized membrane protein (Fun14 family)